MHIPVIVEELNTNILLFFQRNKNALIVFVLAFIAGLGYSIRTRNLSLLIDATTGDYFPSDPDAIGIVRYVQYIVEHGRLMDIDYLQIAVRREHDGFLVLKLRTVGAALGDGRRENLLDRVRSPSHSVAGGFAGIRMLDHLAVLERDIFRAARMGEAAAWVCGKLVGLE